MSMLKSWDHAFSRPLLFSLQKLEHPRTSTPPRSSAQSNKLGADPTRIWPVTTGPRLAKLEILSPESGV